MSTDFWTTTRTLKSLVRNFSRHSIKKGLRYCGVCCEYVYFQVYLCIIIYIVHPAFSSITRWLFFRALKLHKNFLRKSFGSVIPIMPVISSIFQSRRLDCFRGSFLASEISYYASICSVSDLRYSREIFRCSVSSYNPFFSINITRRGEFY